MLQYMVLSNSAAPGAVRSALLALHAYIGVVWCFPVSRLDLHTIEFNKKFGVFLSVQLNIVRNQLQTLRPERCINGIVLLLQLLKKIAAVASKFRLGILNFLNKCKCSASSRA